MSELRSGKREFHGALKHGKEAVRNIPDATAVVADASKFDTFDFTLAVCTTPTINIEGAAEGQRIFIRLVTLASPGTPVINVDGVASDLVGSDVLTASDENTIQVIVYDAATSHHIISGS